MAGALHHAEIGSPWAHSVTVLVRQARRAADLDQLAALLAAHDGNTPRLTRHETALVSKMLANGSGAEAINAQARIRSIRSDPFSGNRYHTSIHLEA